MYKIISKILLVCATSTCLFSCSDTQEQQASVQISSITTANTNFDSTFQGLSGQAIKLSDFRGKTILLNYWATWCAPCIRELPALTRAADILNEDEFVVLMASDESIEVIAEFLEEHNFNGNFIKLNTFFANHGVKAVPSTIMYNSQGEEINTWLGEYEWDSPEVITQLQELALPLY